MHISVKWLIVILTKISHERYGVLNVGGNMIVLTTTSHQ